jgi:hypothetical protein
MRPHAEAPASRKALEGLDELDLGHRARGQEDRIALKSVDDGGGADERAKQRGKVAEHEQAEQHGEVRLDQQRVVCRKQHRRIRGRRGRWGPGRTGSQRFGEQECVRGLLYDVITIESSTIIAIVGRAGRAGSFERVKVSEEALVVAHALL